MSLLCAPDRVAFSIGNLDIYWYALIVTLGILSALVTVAILASKRKVSLDFIFELFLWLIVLAIIFCRVFYVVPRIGTVYHLDSWDGFKDAFFNLRNGGLTIIGGIFGGVLGIICCCLRNKEYSIARTCDLVVIGLLLGQIIGRWGNYCNQELYGKLITDQSMQWFPFAVYIDYCSECGHGGYHNALFFYEGLLNALGFIICLVMYSKRMDKKKPFSIALFYLFWYGIVRGSLEFLKEDHVTIGNSGIGAVQVICYCMSAITLIINVLYLSGVINFAFLDKMKKRENPSLTDDYNVGDGCYILQDKED